MKNEDKAVIAHAQAIVDYCQKQANCQNCIFRLYGCENWHCAIGAFDIRDVLYNVEAKKKTGGYL